jgi:predicted outer membrane repeat protein
VALVATAALAGVALTVLVAGSASATTVNDEATFRAAWSNAAETQIDLAADITLTNCGSGTPLRNSGTALTLAGNGHTIRQTCTGLGVLEQDGSGALSFDRVTITGGDNTFTAGGGIVAHGSVSLTNSTVSGNTVSGAGGRGGGIAGNTTVTLMNSTVSGNTASREGGGINANTAVTLTNSTVSGNTAGTLGGGAFSSNTITATNSTVTNNTATGEGGGLAALDVSLIYATVVNNTAPTGANIEILQFDSLTSFGSVVALPRGGGTNCGFEPPPVTTSNGFNFSDDSSCGFTASTDKQNAGDPGLGALADNGGPTQTRLPQSGSPLIDAIPSDSCQADGASGISADQRGVSRPQGAGCDIGAVEVEVVVVAPSPAPPTPVQVVVRFTG